MLLTTSYLMTQVPILGLTYSTFKPEYKKIDNQELRKKLQLWFTIALSVEELACFLTLSIAEKEYEKLSKEGKIYEGKEKLKNALVAVISIKTLFFSVLVLGALVNLSANPYKRFECAMLLLAQFGLMFNLGLSYSELERYLKEH